MNVFTTTIILECEQRIDNVKWQKCLSDAVEKYRAKTGQDVRSVQFSVKGEAR